MNFRSHREAAMPNFRRSLLDFQRHFSHEAACALWLVGSRWPNGFFCPACDYVKRWRLSGRAFMIECAACHRQTSVTAGTVMRGSKLALSVWFWAAYLMATHSNGMSALHLQRQLGLASYETAWLLSHKLRRAMVAPGWAPLADLVEVNETPLPCRVKDKTRGPGGRGHRSKMLLAGAVENRASRPGRVCLATIADFSTDSLHAFLRDHVTLGATAKTDDWSAYPGAPDLARNPHTIGPMAAHLVLPWVHRIFSNLMRWALGVYHGLQRPISRPVSTNSYSASTAAVTGTPPSHLSSASPSPPNLSLTTC